MEDILKKIENLQILFNTSQLGPVDPEFMSKTYFEAREALSQLKVALERKGFSDDIETKQLEKRLLEIIRKIQCEQYVQRGGVIALTLFYVLNRIIEIFK